ncbi:uncharacterized protein PHALS_13404 [Plasmopara halstedii]|uniref:Uncharacterized protein n=1 Tax=Plasmopara halstedii TaxID=4781 RepID=A0A0P1ANU7_PLAHL|nr:uncharacterized protein PHALS_13404 [Plasmopara halstedii]CEG43190.1 hypothetical protein PHALS_13404 [Plasmopara halstedii]|eukprot:XP_024579559.1 hypothetical protein PHALS_13404 [Plasmopara halstedii]
MHKAQRPLEPCLTVASLYQALGKKAVVPSVSYSNFSEGALPARFDSFRTC